MELDTYVFDIDDRFQGRRTEFQGGSVWVPPPLRTLQPPIFNFALSETVDLEELDNAVSVADDYDGAVRAYFDIKRANVRSFTDSVRSISGRRALVRELEYTKHHGDTERLDVFALFVNIRLDNDFMQEFSADCPLSVREEFAPHFWRAIESYRFKGRAREAIDVQEAARADMYARMDALTTQAEVLLERIEAPAARATLELPPFSPPETDHVELGDFDVSLTSKQWRVGAHSRTLIVEATVELGDLAKAHSLELIPDHENEPKIKIKIDASGVFSTTGPVGTFKLDDGRSEDRSLAVAIDGVDYGMKFSGTADLRGGWVSLRGVIGISYDASRRFPLVVQFRLNPNSIDWSQYVYTSLKELRSAPLNRVKSVVLKQLVREDDLSILGECGSLETLYLSPAQWGDPLPVELPEKLWRIPTLQSLSLRSLKFGGVPNAVESLEHLKYLAVTDCDLTDVSAGLWRLPRLDRLDLSRNTLSELPADIALASLEWIDLSHNQLRTLPENLFELPRLTTIKLTNNRIESLPEQANDEAFSVELEIATKMKVLNYEYRGADGSGTIPWDDGGYYAASSPSLTRVVGEVIEASPECKAHSAALLATVKRAIGARLGDQEDYSVLGNHRVGGMPDLPASIPYPRFGNESHAYEFLCQVDCAAVATMQTYLPRTGFLYFFLSTIHDIFDGDREQTARVIWYDGARESLVSGGSRKIAADEYYEMMGDGYAGYRAEASMIASAPEWYAATQNPHLFRGNAASLADDMPFVDELAYDVFTEPISNRYPFDVGIGTYGFTQHEDPEHQASLAWRGAPEDWMVLLHVKSRGDFQWGDAGDLFFVAHKSDVAKRDFSRVFCTLESS